MTAIADDLTQIMQARKGKDVRQAIHDGIEQCYEDATNSDKDVQVITGYYGLGYIAVSDVLDGDTWYIELTIPRDTIMYYNNVKYVLSPADSDSSFRFPEAGSSMKHVFYDTVENEFVSYAGDSPTDYSDRTRYAKIMVIRVTPYNHYIVSVDSSVPYASTDQTGYDYNPIIDYSLASDYITLSVVSRGNYTDTGSVLKLTTPKFRITYNNIIAEISAGEYLVECGPKTMNYIFYDMVSNTFVGSNDGCKSISGEYYLDKNRYVFIASVKLIDSQSLLNIKNVFSVLPRIVCEVDANKNYEPIIVAGYNLDKCSAIEIGRTDSGNITLTIPPDTQMYYKDTSYVLNSSMSDVKIEEVAISGTSTIVTLYYDTELLQFVGFSGSGRTSQLLYLANPARYIYLGVVRKSYYGSGIYSCDMRISYISNDRTGYDNHAYIVSGNVNDTEFDISASIAGEGKRGVTLTIPADSVVHLNGFKGAFSPVNADRVVQLENTATSTLQAVLYDVFNDEFRLVTANSSFVQLSGNLVNRSRYVLLAFIRYDSSGYTAKIKDVYAPFFSSYTVDHKSPSYQKTCISTEVYENFGNINTISHRGYRSQAPENTLHAFALAKKKGFTHIETDLQFTSDGYPVLLHDATVDRTSNGTGAIAEMTLAEARELDFGSWFDTKYAGTKIPTLEEAVILCKRLNIGMALEIKAGTTEQLSSVIAYIKRMRMTKNVLFTSQYRAYLGRVVSVDPDLDVGWIQASITDETITEATTYLQKENNKVVLLPTGVADADVVNLAVSNGFDIGNEGFTKANILATLPEVNWITAEELNPAEVIANNIYSKEL